MKAFLREILGTLILAVVIFFLLQTTIRHSVVMTASMEPTLPIGHHLLVNKVVYKIFHEPERGDIITFYPPNNPKTVFIKRVIGLPNDTVAVKEGMVYVNDSPLSEPYIKEPPRYIFHQQKIPENNYFVLGDNRNNSTDSHTGWTVKRKDIIGKAWLSIWPPSEWGLAPNYPLQEQLARSTKLLFQLP